MAITVSFTTNQVVGSPQNFVLVDTSTGSDVLAVSRRIYVTNQANQYLTSNYTISNTSAYTSFPLSDGSTKTVLTIFSQDVGVNVQLVYVDAGGNILYSETVLKGFTLYEESFYYSLTQAQAQQNTPPPTILQDSNYYMNKMILRVNIDSGDQAISLGNDITSSQNCYLMGTYMLTKQADLF